MRDRRLCIVTPRICRSYFESFTKKQRTPLNLQQYDLMKKHYRHENNCLNCGTTLEGKFCHNCGQENLEVKESFGHMMNHAISDYFHFDHQFFHTLKPLLFKPGYLTNEYMAGRRVQYLHPVKMYIFISIVYFLLLFQSGNQNTAENKIAAKPTNTQKVIDSVKKKKIIDSVKKEIAKAPGLTAEQKKQAVKFTYLGANYAKQPKSKLFSFSGNDTTYAKYIAAQNKLPTAKKDGFFGRKMSERILKFHDKYGERTADVFEDELRHNIPKMMFLLLPLFALVLSITFRKNKKFYVEHLIYSFHLHCFIFLFISIIILVELLIPNSWGVIVPLSFLVGIYIAWYVYKSLRVVYVRSRFRTVTKAIGMFFVYLLMTSVCLMLVTVITALTAS